MELVRVHVVSLGLLQWTEIGNYTALYLLLIRRLGFLVGRTGVGFSESGRRLVSN